MHKLSAIQETQSLGRNSSQLLSSNLLIIHQPFAPKQVVLLFPLTKHFSLFQLLSHLSFSNIVKRKSRCCHLWKTRQHLHREVLWHLSRHRDGIHILPNEIIPFSLTLMWKFLLLFSFEDNYTPLIIKKRSWKQRAKRYQSPSWSKMLTVLIKNIQWLLRNTIDISHAPRVNFR